MRRETIELADLPDGLKRAIRRFGRGHYVDVTDHGRVVAGLRLPRSTRRLPRPLDLPARMSGERAIDLLRRED